MKTRDLKSLSETIASVVDPIDKERAQMLQEGFLNSLTEKARQIASKEMEDEDEEEDEMEDEGEEEEEKPSSKKKAKMMKEEIELAEKAAPGYEDWASDPKVKASFKKQYGKRWKEVMYGHSWNLVKQEKKVGLDEETLDEAVSAKRMRIIRKYVKGNKRVPEHLKDYMERSFKKKRAKDAKLSDGRGAVGALETRMRRKSAALRARGVEPKGVAPGYLEEGILKKLMRIKGAAYKAELASRGADPNTSLEGLVKAAKLKRAAAEQTAKIAAGMARRGGASPDAVRGGGSRIGKSGKYTQKAGKLANQRDKAMRSFRSMSGVKELMSRGEDKSEKRARQQAQAAFVKKARTGDFGQDNQASLRARSNFQKRYGRLKGK